MIKRLLGHWFRPALPLPTLLFFRQFGGFTGGHLKLWDYYNHVRASGLYQAQIYFTPDSLWHERNPWYAEQATVLTDWQPQRADALFLAGLDWLALPESARPRFSRPILNLIQGLRHADPQDARYPLLSHRAVRICVSQEVADAVRQTGRAQGPVFAIPNGLDWGQLPTPVPTAQRDGRVLIAGLKQPALARALHAQLTEQGVPAQVLDHALPRQAFLSLLAQAPITVFLPCSTEGFYLPALEGMALGSLVICPDCVGNRGFCLPEENCLQPAYTLDSIVASLHRARHLNLTQQTTLLSRATQTAEGYSLAQERRSFLAILRELPQLW